VLKKVFIDFGYHKITKLFNASLALTSCVGLSLIVHFTIKNFSKDLVMRYAPSFSVMLYVSKRFNLIHFFLAFLRLRPQMITSMIISMLLENEVFYLLGEQKRLFWSINSAGSQARLIILKKASRINCYTYIIYTVLALWSIAMLPVFGNHREWLMIEDVSDQYLGSSSKMISQMFFYCAPFAIYSSFRHCGTLLYNILQLCLQFFLINEHILQISDDKTIPEKLSFEKRLHHQNQTFKKFCFCIQHHVVITR
jgi:hypothetical protein